MMLADRRRIFWFATVATATSVLGGYLGYAIGYYAFDSFGTAIITTLSSQASFDRLQEFFTRYGFWAIVFKGATPIPFKLVTILSGFLHFNLAQFTVASVIARGMRFYLEATLLYAFGERGRAFIEERLTLVTTVSAGVIVGGVLLIRYF
jgi:membrane protein YqaA with SNARE-associated domain